MLEVGEGEVVWLNPSTEGDALAGSLLWDNSVCERESGRAEAWELMTKAFKTQLGEQESATLTAELNGDPKLVYQCGLTPALLPDLVEKNPNHWYCVLFL